MSDFSDTLGQIGNVIGWIGGQGLNLLNMVATIEHGGLPNYLANRAQLAQDPGSRALLEQSPFYAGMAGYGMPGQVPNPADIRSGYSNTGDIIRGIQGNPSLPPLLPPAGTMTPEQAGQYAKTIGVGTPGGPTMATVNTPFGAERFGGTPASQANAIPAEPEFVHQDGEVFVKTVGGTLRPLGREKTDQGGGEDPDWVKALFTGAPAAAQGEPAAAPDAAPTAQPAPAQAPAQPAPSAPPRKAFPTIPASQLLEQQQQERTRVGFPSPAFQEGGAPIVQSRESIPQWEARHPTMTAQAAPAPAPTVPAAPTLRPGMTVTKKLKGGTTISMRAQSPKPVPAVAAREMANLATAANAAEQAIALVQKGPQAPLEVMGRPIMRAPGLAGPVTGRALTALGKISGQPLAVEEANLRALIDHAKTGVTAIFGQHLTKENRDFVEALLPDVNQPTNILLTHLHRLSIFYRNQAEFRETLANLSPEQRQAFALTAFHQTMLGIPAEAPQTTVGPLKSLPPLDVR